MRKGISYVFFILVIILGFFEGIWDFFLFGYDISGFVLMCFYCDLLFCYRFKVMELILIMIVFLKMINFKYFYKLIFLYIVL